VQEVKAETPKAAPKPERGNLRNLKVDETGKVVEKDAEGERLHQLLIESLKNTKGNENFPAATVEKEAPTEKPAVKTAEEPVEHRATERRAPEAELPEGQEERRQGDRRNAAGVRVDENGDPVMSPDVQGHWQQGVFGEKPAEDIGAKARAANPEPTRAETKAASLPKEEPVGYTPKAEETVKVGEEGRTPAKSAEEYHPAVEQKVNELSDENLRKLAKAHGLNPDEYDFNARDARRHRTERDQLAKDVTAQMGEDEKINLGRASETTEREPGFANVDKSAKGRANRAAKLFPRLRGPVDEFGNPKVSGGSPAVTEAPGFSDVAKRAQEMKDAAKEEAPHTPANYYGEPLSYTHDEDLHHIITKDAKGEKIGELVAKDIAPGTVEVTSNQVYGKELQGTGRGVDQVQHLLDNVDEGTHTVNSDISTTPQARGAWDKVMNANPDAVTKKVYKDGQTQYTVDMDKYRESRIGPGVEQKVNPGHTRDEAAGFDPNKFRTATDEGLTRLGQKKSRLGKIGR
jgi:hypothetical protein